jgi:hypothetical protein
LLASLLASLRSCSFACSLRSCIFAWLLPRVSFTRPWC